MNSIIDKLENNEYTLEELSELLNTSIYTLRRRIYDGRLKAIKIFGEYRVSKDELVDFLNREDIGAKLIYFNNKGNLYKKEIKDLDELDKEVKYLVEKVKVLANTDAARLYYERKLYTDKK